MRGKGHSEVGACMLCGGQAGTHLWMLLRQDHLSG